MRCGSEDDPPPKEWDYLKEVKTRSSWERLESLCHDGPRYHC